MVSERTKKSKFLKILFTILHILCLVGPFLFFIPFGFIGAPIVGKIALGFSTVLSIILAAFSIFIDIKHRAGLHRGIMWTLISGVLFCLESIKPFIWIMALVSILDELVFLPLRNRFAVMHATNKEIDKRF